MKKIILSVIIACIIGLAVGGIVYYGCCFYSSNPESAKFCAVLFGLFFAIVSCGCMLEKRKK